MLRLYYHPLASFCWKALIALYENDTPFEAVLVDLADPASRDAFAAVWPLAKFPVLRDVSRANTVAEASVVIEYLDVHFPGRTRFIPADADAAWRARLWDRFYDHYIHEPMQKIVLDSLRPEGQRDAAGVEQARAQILQSYAIAGKELGARQWAMGDAFSLVDCAAAPALFYANTIVPFADAGNLAGYLQRLTRRDSFARVLKEAEPYFGSFPLEPKPRIPG